MKNDPANFGHAESCACLRPGDAMCNCGQIYDEPTDGKADHAIGQEVTTQPRSAAQDAVELLRGFQSTLGAICPDDPDDAATWRRIDSAIALLTQPAVDLEDAARLDFLARAGDVFISMIQDAPGDGFIRVSHDLGADGIGETLRAAIDAARRARGEKE